VNKKHINNIVKIQAFLMLAVLMFLFSSCQKYPDNGTVLKDSLNSVDQTTDSTKKDITDGQEKIKEVEKDNLENVFKENGTNVASESEGYQNLKLTEEELIKYRPNELGEVMILMYHKIGRPESEWIRTPENFKKDLINLYENGYRLINLLDYVRGNIDIEAGKSPVIITFDDAAQGQLNFIETADGPEIDPECAVAILGDFFENNPDFGKGATFYIFYPNPFGQVKYLDQKLKYLLNNGYEIGNHTYSHASLSAISEQDAIAEIALHSAKTSEILPGYEVRSISLPYGQHPENKNILLAGNYQGHEYINEAVLLVGSNPAPSPFDSNFDSFNIPRIRASEIKVDNMGLYNWIEYFSKYPGKKYISDGNKNTITAPEQLSININMESASGKSIYFYK